MGARQRPRHRSRHHSMATAMIGRPPRRASYASHPDQQPKLLHNYFNDVTPVPLQPVSHSINQFHRYVPIRLRAGRSRTGPSNEPHPRAPKTTTTTAEEPPSAPCQQLH